MDGKMKNGRVIVDIIPCLLVASLETDAFVAFVPYMDKMMVTATLARGREKKVLKDQLLF